MASLSAFWKKRVNISLIKTSSSMIEFGWHPFAPIVSIGFCRLHHKCVFFKYLPLLCNEIHQEYLVFRIFFLNKKQKYDVQKFKFYRERWDPVGSGTRSFGYMAPRFKKKKLSPFHHKSYIKYVMNPKLRRQMVASLDLLLWKNTNKLTLAIMKNSKGQLYPWQSNPIESIQTTVI